MHQETYKGVPRSKIPWYPTIDYEKCISCGKCVDYCKLGAYEFEEKEGKKVSVVKNPNNCVVFCTGCEEQCPTSAIKFPSKKETREIIKKLQKQKLNDMNRGGWFEERRCKKDGKAGLRQNSC